MRKRGFAVGVEIWDWNFMENFIISLMCSCGLVLLVVSLLSASGNGWSKPYLLQLKWTKGQCVILWPPIYPSIHL